MTTFNPDRDRERKGKLNMRKLKTLISEVDFYRVRLGVVFSDVFVIG